MWTAEKGQKGRKKKEGKTKILGASVHPTASYTGPKAVKSAHPSFTGTSGSRAIAILSQMQPRTLPFRLLVVPPTHPKRELCGWRLHSMEYIKVSILAALVSVKLRSAPFASCIVAYSRWLHDIYTNCPTSGPTTLIQWITCSYPVF